MNAFEVVEKAKKSGTVDGVEDEALYKAVERLELMIQKHTGSKFREFDKNNTLLACGEIADGYDNMYDRYLKLEACLIREDWNCFGNYETLFNIEWDKFKKEYLRNHMPASGSFTPDWEWS